MLLTHARCPPLLSDPHCVSQFLWLAVALDSRGLRCIRDCSRALGQVSALPAHYAQHARALPGRDTRAVGTACRPDVHRVPRRYASACWLQESLSCLVLLFTPYHRPICVRLEFSDISLSRFAHLQTARRLPCGHMFHTHCLRRWLETDLRCPTCRVQLNVLAPPPPVR